MPGDESPSASRSRGQPRAANRECSCGAGPANPVSGVLQPPAITTGTPREVPDPAREDSGEPELSKRPRSSCKEDQRWLKREPKGIRKTLDKILARMKGAGLTREERPVDLDPVVHGNHETCQTAEASDRASRDGPVAHTRTETLPREEACSGDRRSNGSAGSRRAVETEAEGPR
jgi:hypothetical protein